MNNSKKLLAVLSTAAISTIIASAVATPASAKMASVLLKDASGKIYEYNYEDLQDSFAGGTALYDDFKAVKDAGAQVISYYDDVQNGFVSRSTILDAWGDAEDDFNPQTATETLTTTPVEGTIYERVENPDGTISEQPKSDDSQAEIEAENAVKAYEDASINKYDDVKAADDLKTAATTAIDAVADTTKKDAFTARVTAKTEELDTVKAAKVEAVNDATNQVSLNNALSFFNGVDTNLIVSYDNKFNGAETSVEGIQAGIYDVNLASKLNEAITIGSPNTVNQLKLQSALQYGVDVKVLTGVDFDKYFGNYVTVAEGYAAVTDFDTAAKVQTSLIDAAISDSVTAAEAAVTTAETTPNADNIAAADTAVNALPADVAPDTTKADLNARIEAIRPVAPVLAAKASNSQSALLAALQSDAFTRVNSDLIVQYIDDETGIASTDTTVAAIQGKIDSVNLTAAQGAVTVAQTAPLTAAKVATAQKFVTALPDDAEGVTTKADLQNDLDVVNALLAVDGASSSNSASVLTVLQNNAEVLGLTGTSAVNAPYADAYKTALYAGDQGTRDTAADVQGLISGVNTTKLNAAQGAVTVAQTAPLTAEKVATAQDLVTALPADAEGVTTKADLQTRLDVVNALLAVDGAVTAPNATDASVLAALQDNATVLGLTGTHVINPNLDYKTAFTDAGNQTSRDTAAEVVAIVDGVNDPSTALTNLQTPGANSDEELALLQEKTLNLTGVVEANKDAYFADASAIGTAAETGAAEVQKVVNAVNAIVSLNSATTASDAKTALTTFSLNTDNTTYIDSTSTAKLELADLILVNKPDSGYANIADVQAAITDQNTARASLISAVNTATTNSTMATALGNIGYDAFNNLSASEKIDTAENFISDFPTDSGNRVPYTTLTAIKTAVDAAIAK